MRSSKSRSRNKSNRQRSMGNIVNRVFDSSGPEGKVRGTPQQIIEKYLTLARDAQLSNDRVAEQNFLQHAEHYTRMLGAAQKEMAQQQEERQRQQNQQRDQRGGNGEGEEGQMLAPEQDAPMGLENEDAGDESNIVATPEAQAEDADAAAPRAEKKPRNNRARSPRKPREPKGDKADTVAAEPAPAPAPAPEGDAA